MFAARRRVIANVAARSVQQPGLAVRTLSAAPAKPAAPAKGGKAPAKGGAAKGKKAGKESKFGNTLTAGSTGFSVGEKIPIGIMKEGQDPLVKADAEYPEWLWKVAEVPTLNDCVRILEEDEAQGKKNVPVAVRLQRLKRTVGVLERLPESTQQTNYAIPCLVKDQDV